MILNKMGYFFLFLYIDFCVKKNKQYVSNYLSFLYKNNVWIY